MGDNGSSWSVPVFVLDSQHANVLGAAEDQILSNGNPHPVNGHLLNANQNQNLGFFEDVADLAEVQQENGNYGLEIPNPPIAQGGNNGWVPWIQQEGEIVDENELAEVNNLAEAVVANMILQHPDQAQHSTSMSSETRAFFRAQGAPVTVELPLPATAGGLSVNRTLVVSRNEVQSFESDSQIRELAASHGLHLGFGPAPSVEMLLQDLATLAQEAQMNLPLKGPAVPTSWRFWPDSEALDSWHLLPDNPLWGNNAEASSFSGPRRPRLQRIQVVPPQDDPPLLLQAAVDNPPLPLQAAVDMTQMEESGKEIVIYN